MSWMSGGQTQHGQQLQQQQQQSQQRQNTQWLKQDQPQSGSIVDSLPDLANSANSIVPQQQLQNSAYQSYQQPIQQNNWFNPNQNLQYNSQRNWSQNTTQQQQFVPPPNQQQQFYYQEPQNVNVRANQQPQLQRLPPPPAHNFVHSPSEMTSQLPSQAPQNSFDPEPSDSWNDWNDWNDNKPAGGHFNQNNTIAESFSNEANDNWNWNIEESKPAANFQATEPQQPPASSFNNQAENSQQFQKQQRQQHQLQDPQQTRSPDEQKNTQFLGSNPLLSRVKKEHHLTAQWSTESQMSNTSSERSGESNDLDSRSTNTSDEQNPSGAAGKWYPPHQSEQQPTNFFSQVERKVNEGRQQTVGDIGADLDSLDQALLGFTQHSQPNPNLLAASLEQGTTAAGKSPAYFTPPTNFNQIQQQPIGNLNATPVSSLAGPIRSENFHHAPPTVKSLPLVQTAFSAPIEPQSTVASPVYVTQAKPVSQPTRQFAMSPAAAGPQPHPGNSPSPGLPPPPAIQPFPLQNQGGNSSGLPPPPPLSSVGEICGPAPPIAVGANTGNPFKRTGAPQHHRVIATTAANTSSISSGVIPPPAQFFAPSAVSQHQGPQFGSPINQEILSPDNTELFPVAENHEIAPNNDRNQYLQTGHLSEEGYSNEQDSLPPPGLSRYVLGEPEHDSQQSSFNQPEIPPGLDRMVPGIELDAADLEMERHADGEDTAPRPPRSTFAANLNDNGIDLNSQSIDINADRNLYQVPGESDVHETRVVTGLENDIGTQLIAVEPEQRELELDGENLEDQHQQNLQQQNFQTELEITRDEPIEGANTLDEVTSATNANANSQETESSITIETGGGRKDHSNASTCDDSDRDRGRHTYLAKNVDKRLEDKKKRGGPHEVGKGKRRDRYETEESEDYSSDHERRRGYREGSARNEHDRDYRSGKERRDKREGSVKDRDYRYRDDKENTKETRRERGGDRRDKYERGDRNDSNRYGNNSRYETDSKYETEGSTRYERHRGDRHDRDYRGDRSGGAVDERERKHRRDRYDREDRRRGAEREEYYRNDRRRDNRAEKRTDYDDDYNRRSGSRNARDSDREKDVRPVREKDVRYQNTYGYAGATGYGYDAYYYQQQQYYEQLRRTNPQAYAEWYRKYYGAAGSQTADTSVVGVTDGRESVHSGRSSANNEKERYSLQLMHRYYQQQQQQQPNEYHHHFTQPMANSSLNSTAILDTPAAYGGLTFQQQTQHQQYQEQFGYNGNYFLSASRSYYANSEYSETRAADNLGTSLNQFDGSASAQDPQRLTPSKFTIDHSSVSLSNGLLVCVKPKYSSNGVSNIVKVLKLGANDSTRRLFQTFPGPLIRGLTHKKTIIEFCEDQIRLGPASIAMKSRQNSVSSIFSVGQAHKASFTLMWNLLILLLRQNGVVVGTDIAELLMKNKTQYPYDIQNSSKASSQLSRRGSVQSKSKDQTASDADGETKEDPNADDLIADELDSKKPLSEDEITEKFRNYLLYGNVNEALEWATDNNLWGHALFLASKVDRRSHANVLMKFANKLALNDPLQTLYQLMSGRSPSSVTSVQDEKWGDWRPHLAMILSNTAQRPELNRKAITTLGDSLYNRGDLLGAQFCYLMAQVGFGRYSTVNQESTFMSNSASAVRLVLLGSSHHKTFREFATNESIMMTEIYEYACALNDEKFSIVEFQPYKYLLATRMLDYGFHLKTLMYMEQISVHIQISPTKYDSTFIEKIYKIADQLKFFDPVLEKSLDEQQNDDSHMWNDQNDSQQQQQQQHVEEQKWLQDLRNILIEFNSGILVQDIPINGNGGNGQQQHNMSEFDSTRSQIDQQFVAINQQFSELALQYNNYDSAPAMHVFAQEQPHEQLQQQQSSVLYGNQINDQYNSGPPGEQNIDQKNEFYGQQQYNPGQNVGQSQEIGGGFDVAAVGYGQYQQSPAQAYDSNLGYVPQQQPDSSLEYWNQQQQTAMETPKPIITMPNSISNKSGFYGDDDNHGGGKSHDNSGAAKLNDDKKSDGNKKIDSKNHKSLTGGSSNNSGWFGGIWNKLSLKPKNQMILPDDKNPSIVWDADKKRWVNTDGDESVEESFKPPPKMADLRSQSQGSQQQQQQQQQSPPPQTLPAQQQPSQFAPNQQQQQQQLTMYGNSSNQPLQQTHQSKDVPMVPTNPANPLSAISNNNNNDKINLNSFNKNLDQTVNKTPSLQSNMFKMQRNRTLKKSYVDVFNPSGAPPSKPIEPVLAPTVPTAVPQTGFFIPSPVVNSGDDLQQQQQEYQQQEVAPQFYNPNQYVGGGGGGGY